MKAAASILQQKLTDWLLCSSEANCLQLATRTIGESAPHMSPLPDNIGKGDFAETGTQRSVLDFLRRKAPPSQVSGPILL